MPEDDGRVDGQGLLEVVVLGGRTTDQRPSGKRRRSRSIVASVVVVDGPVVGTTWSSVQPALVGPGHRRRPLPAAWPRTAIA